MKKSLRDFNKFLSSGCRSNPFISVRKNGQIAFSMGAVNKYQLDYEFVILWMSNDGLTVGIEFTNDQNKEGIIKIQKRTGNFSFSAGAFLKMYDLIPDDTKNYKFNWNSVDKIAFFHPKGKVIGNSKINIVNQKRPKPYSFEKKISNI